MTDKVAVRHAAGLSICRTAAYAKKLVADSLPPSEEIRTHAKFLGQQWKKYCDLHDIILGVTGEKEMDAQQDIIIDIEDQFIIASSKLNTWLHIALAKENPTPTDPPAVKPTDTNVSPLPRISLPTFNTGYVEWQSFSDLYKVLVHTNRGLTNVEKFHYLRSSTSGEAATLIAHITVTNENYPLAWETLQNRFTDLRVITNALLDQLFKPQSVYESAESLKAVIDDTTQAMQMLQNLKRPVMHWDDVIVYHITKRLPRPSRVAWETIVAPAANPPTWKQLCDFLQSRFRMLEATSSATTSTQKTAFYQATPSPRPSNHQPHTLRQRTAVLVTTNTGRNQPSSGSKTPTTGCILCQRHHRLAKCQSFLKRSEQDRAEFVTINKLCQNCLQSSHETPQCPSQYRCTSCKMLHHTLLHNSSLAAVHAVQINHPTVLLATARVRITNQDGQTLPFTALLDQGSQITIITERAAQALKLPRKNKKLIISTVGQSSTNITSNGTVNITLESIHDHQSVMVQANVLPTITSYLPSTKVNWQAPAILPGPLADPHWNSPKAIDILIGADYYVDIIQSGVEKINNGNMVAQQTIFGWLLSGRISSTTKSCSRPTSCHTHTRVNNTSCAVCALTIQHQQPSATINDEISQLLRRFWEIHETRQETASDNEAETIENYYKSTHQRLKDGRYVARLPFKSIITASTNDIGPALASAIRRLHQVERSNQRKPELQQQYHSCLNEYITLNHMSRIPKDRLRIQHGRCSYLPHHAVVKPSSTTTKVRVVFDASCITESGSSLNNNLLVGPTLQPDLTTILSRWRRHKVVFCADIEKMYRQILVHRQDQDFQRIVWRRSDADPIEHYRLHTVTFGAAAAPYLAVRTLLQLAEDEEARFPWASRVIKTDMYVDDLMSGADDINSALALQQQVIKLLQSGSMPLRKWSSNANELLQRIPASHRECKFPLSMDQHATVRTLGITWDPATDCFGFTIDFPISSSPQCTTKRQLLSDASRLYDPLGWLAPTTIIPKILFQQLWLLKIDWDDKIPPELHQNWREYLTQLPALTSISISRWTGQNLKTPYQLHGFSDASTTAYAAVVYMRLKTEPAHITLIAAKTRVAPLKVITVPRLELCGMALLADLMQDIIKNTIGVRPTSTYAWCDSEITLKWLKIPPSRLKVFIGNRTSSILEKLPDCHFRHIRSEDNPADLATRGISPTELQHNSLWWQGPHWLNRPSTTWPNPAISMINTDLELRTVQVNVTCAEPPISLLIECSSLAKLVCITAHCRRFLNNFAAKWQQPSSTTKNENQTLTTEELNGALAVWLRRAQQDEFQADLQSIHGKSKINGKSKLSSLHPFIDIHGIMRVGGRLRHSALQFNHKYPIILPKKHRVTQLLLVQSHAETLHGNVELMMNHIRQKFWIVHSRGAIRKCISQCVKCRRFSPKQGEQLMADLPEPRVTPARPFNTSAVDYAGPISTCYAKRRGRKIILKSYICIFVCFATKAVHLEVVSEMTTEAFIAAFRRFVGRRGHIAEIYSDNGTNFVGADRMLQQHVDITKRASSQAELAQVRWHFSPPATPHFNGLAESGVKSMKKHLLRTAGTAIFTYEELNTIIVQIEACLNSRPLCRVSDDPSQHEILTPGHFLVGGPLLTPVEPDYTEAKCTTSRWRNLQRCQQLFWKKWSIEYLTELQNRKKWPQGRPQPEIGDVVLIMEDNSPPLRWPMGRIEELHPGKDGLCRVVGLRTATHKIINRHVSKLVWLPVD